VVLRLVRVPVGFAEPLTPAAAAVVFDAALDALSPAAPADSPAGSSMPP